MSESEQDEYIEEIGEEEEEEEYEDIEEEGHFTLDQINIMIQATELWDQLIQGSKSLEEVSQYLGTRRRTARRKTKGGEKTEKAETEETAKRKILKKTKK
ncbi:MAG: RNA polymerase subunit Rpo13 [Sulfolobales archaeon]